MNTSPGLAKFLRWLLALTAAILSIALTSSVSFGVSGSASKPYDAGIYNTSSFYLVSGETITGYTYSNSGDPYLYLYGPSGTEVARDDDSAGSYNSRIVYTASSTGYYYFRMGCYSSGSCSYSLTWSSSLPGLTPTFATPVSTTGGFTVQVSNYDSNYSWSVSTTAGSASINGSGLVTVTGLSAGQSATVTVNTSRSGYPNGSASRAGTALNLGFAFTLAGDGARVGVNLVQQPVIQLKTLSTGANLAQSGVTVTLSTSHGTISGNTAVTDSFGVATFTNLQFTSGTLGTTATLTASASGYVSNTQTVKIQTLPTKVTISTSSTSNGNFVAGNWFANSQAESIINTSDLSTQIAAGNVLVEAAYTSSSTTDGADGTIFVRNPVAVSSLSAERTLTLKATNNIYGIDTGSLSATGNKLNVILWTDSDGVNGGGTQLVANSSSTPVISTNGGHLAMGGGASSATWNGLTIPASYSKGQTANTGMWHGIELVDNNASGGSKLISTNGGNLRIWGTSASTTSSVNGIQFISGEIATGSGNVEFNGQTTSNATTDAGENYGVAIGTTSQAPKAASLITTGAVSITGTAASTYSGARGIFVGSASLNASSSTITLDTDKAVLFGGPNSVASLLDVNATGNIAATAAQTWSGGAELSCTSGTFTNPSGAITVSGSLTVQCETVTTSAAISSSGNTLLESTGTSSTTTIGANVTSSSAGGSLTIKSKASVSLSSGVTVQTTGRNAGSGGNIVLWSDSDASGQGFITTGANVTMNTIGGSTTTYTGGGDIHFAGGLDNGSTTISAAATSGDGLPDSWAISTSGDFGIQVGSGADVNSVSRFYTGGGDLRMFGKATTASDGFALNWATIADAGEGQIELQADSIYWGLQINRAGDNNTFNTKSVFTSRSNTSPAIKMHGRSSTTGANMAVLGSYGDTATDNLTIQALGTGGIDIIGEAPSSTLSAVGFTSTAILSNSGTVKIDGGTRGTHFGVLVSGHSQGSVTLGRCAVATCSNSLVTSSTADVELIGNRLTSYGSINTTVATTGELTVVPAVGSTALNTNEFANKANGFTLSSDLGGLTFGRPGDSTIMDLTSFSANIAGPITIHSNYIRLYGDLTTTVEGSDIRLYAMQNIHSPVDGVDFTTNGGDVVMWTNTDKVAGTTQTAGAIYLLQTNITTNGGKIWLAGGLDDGGVDAGITTAKGKWSSVTAGDGFPDGYAVGDSDTTEWSVGVNLDNDSVLKSGGGDIFIAGALGPTGSSTGHIYLKPGVKIDSGSGRIAMWAKSLGAQIGSQGIALNVQGVNGGGGAVMITSDANSQDAISIYADSSAANGWSRGVTTHWYGDLSATRGYQGTQILATHAGGGINLTGIGGATNNNAGGSGLYLDFLDVLAVDGDININGYAGPSSIGQGVTFGWHNNGANLVRLGGWTVADSEASGGDVITTPSGVTADFSESSSNVTINADGVWMRTSSTPMRGVYSTTSGAFKILPATVSSGVFAAADSFRNAHNSLDWSFERLKFPVTPASIQIGAPATSTAITVGAPLIADGQIAVYGSALSFPNSITSSGTSGNVLLNSTSTVAISADVSAGSGGVLIKSVGRITLSGGASASSPRKITTTSGPITLWTTSTAGGVVLPTYTKLDSASSGSGGADITIGGGSDDGNGRPAGNSIYASGTAIELGSTDVADALQILSGTGEIVIRGESTHASIASSGVDITPGARIIGSTVNIFGKNIGTSSTQTESAGVHLYANSSAKALIEATGDFPSNTTALRIVSESQNAYYGLMLSNATSATATHKDVVTLRASGANGDIEVSGSTARAGVYNVQLAGMTFETFAGDVTIDSGTGTICLTRSSDARRVAFAAASGGTGGDVTIITSKIDSCSTGFITAAVAGTFSVVPPAGESFSAATTFPMTSSTMNVGGLIVGSVDNTADLTQGSAITSAGNVKYLGGSQTANFAITTSAGGNIEFYPTGSFSKSTNAFDADGDILIGTSSQPVTSATLSTSTLTAGSDVKAYSSGTLTQGAAISAGDAVHLESTANDLSLQKNITAGAGGIYAKAAGNIVASGGTSSIATAFSAPGGNITFHSDSNANGGYIHLNNYTTLSTGAGGGNITLSGGSDVTTGFALNNSTTQFGGIHFGEYSGGLPKYASGISLTAGTGDVLIRGKSDGVSSSRGVIIPLASSATVETSISGGDITVIGTAVNSGSWYGIEMGLTSGQTTNSSQVTFAATGALSMTGTGSNYDGLIARVSYDLSGDSITLTGSGPRKPISLESSYGNIAAGDGGLSITSTKTSSSDSGISQITPLTLTSTGNVSIVHNRAGSASSFTLGSSSGDISVTNANLTLTSDYQTIGGPVSLGTGVATFTPHTSGATITAGTEVANTLSLSSAELGYVTAGTLRLTTTGDVNVTANLNFTDKVTNFAIRAGGDVTGSAGVAITVANLGIDAGGNISFPGNQVASVIALTATGVSYNQTADYTVASVDGIAPEFGYGVKFAISNVPVSGTLDGFMAVAFNPPPTVYIRDSFGNTLASNNLSSADFVVTPSLTVLSTSTGTLALSGTTATVSGGTHTFSSLAVSGGTGTGTITFSATRNGTALSENSSYLSSGVYTLQSAATFTTSTYNIQAGEPASIALSFTATSAPAGKIGLAPTATLKDSQGNTITTGEHADAEITISISGNGGNIVSGNTATTATGVASFPNLIVSGSVGTNYTLTFSTTFYSDVSSQNLTVTGTQVVTLTPGDATKLSIDTSSSSVANRTDIPDLTVSVLDAYDNVVTSSTAAVSVSVGAGANLGGQANLSGYSSAVSAVSGEAVFSGLSLAAVIDDYTLSFSSNGLAGTSSTISITHGAAYAINLTAPTSVVNDATFGSSVVAEIVDQEGNRVTTGSQSTQTVTVTASGASLTGTNTASASSGVATLSGLKLTGTVGSKTLTATIADPSSITASANVTITYGSATQIALTTQAAGFANRKQFTTQPVVTFQDVSGNAVEDYVGTVTATVSLGATLSGDADISITSSDLGVASFNDLSLIAELGTYTITYAASGFTSVTQSATVTHGDAYALVLTYPTSVVNDVAFSSQPVIEIVDQEGNRVTTGSQSTQTVSLSATGAVLGGTTSMSAVAGIADFDGLGVKLTGLIGPKPLTASISSPASITATENVTVTFGSATKVAITTSAAGFVNRTNFTTQPVVKVQDVSGNTVTDFAGDISIAVGAGATLTGTTTISLTATELGIANFAGVGIYGTVGGYDLTASSDGLADATQSFNLTHGVATKLALTRNSSGARSGIAFDTQPQVKVLDQDDNTVTTSAAATATIMVSYTGNSYNQGGADLSGTVTATAVGGVANFSGLKFSGLVGDYDLSYSVFSPSDYQAFTAVTETVTLAAGDFAAIEVSQQPQTIAAGAEFAANVEVLLVDAWGNTVLTDSSTQVSPKLVSTDNQSVVDDTNSAVTAVSGVVDFDGLTFTASGEYKIRFVAGAISQLSENFTITNAEASQIVWVSQEPTAIRSDIAVTPNPTFEIQDTYGNPVTVGSRYTVTASAIGANAAEVQNIAGGSVTQATGASQVELAAFKVRALADSYSFRFTASDGVREFYVDTTSPVPLTFGNPAQLNIATQASGANAGLAFNVQPEIEILDAAGNLVSDSTLAVTATVAGRTLVGTQTISAVAGVADFADSGLGIEGAAAQGLNLVFTIEYPIGTPISTSQSIDLTAGTATFFAITTEPSDLVTRETFDADIEVELRDRFGNPATADSSSQVSAVLYDANDELAVATIGTPDLAATTATAANGVVTFSGLSYAVRPADGYYIKLSYASYSVDTEPFTVFPGVVAALQIETQPDDSVPTGLMKTGDLIPTQPKIKLYDQDGYLATNATGTVSAAVDNSGDISTGSTTATVSAGIAQFSGMKLIGTPAQRGAAATDYKLTFSFGDVDSDPSDVLNVTNADAHHLVLTRGASSGRSDEAFDVQPIVEIRDRFENLVETGTGASKVIRIGTSGGRVSGANKQAVLGTATFTSFGLEGTAGTPYNLTYEVVDEPGITTANQTGVTVTYGFAAKLGMYQAPISLDVNSELTKTGDALATQPVIRVLDNWGNTVLDSSAVITASLVATTDDRDRLEGATVTAVNGEASFTDLALIVRPETNYRLNFTSGSLTLATSDNLQVRHGDAASINIITQPSSTISESLVTKTGEILATTPIVEVLDFDGNRTTSLSDEVITATVSVGDGSAVDTLDENDLQLNQAVVTNGVAEFTQLRVVALPDVPQKLTFSSTISSTNNTITTPADSDEFILTFNDAYKLAIATQPCAGVLDGSNNCQVGITGETLGVQPVIHVQDRYNNLVTSYNGTASVSTSTSGATILVGGIEDVSLQTAEITSGVATFADLGLIATPTVANTFSFTAGSLQSVSSQDIYVAAAQAASIVMDTQPTGGRTGDLLAAQPKVKLLDRFGNHVLSDSATEVTIELVTAGGTLTDESGNNFVATAQSGVVSFSNLRFSGVPGADYELSFSSSGLTPATSNSFSVANGLAANLVITSQPIGGKAGDLLTRGITLELLDAEGNLAEDDNSTTVTVAITTTDTHGYFVNSSDQSISLTMQAVGGVIDFGDLRVVGTPGFEYGLTFTATDASEQTTYDSLQTELFTLTHANPAEIRMLTSAVGGLTGEALTTQPRLRIYDRFGNLATLDSSTVVTASILNDVTGSVVGGGQVTAVNGLVNFQNLTVEGVPGTSYTLTFAATTSQGASFSVNDSASFTLSTNATLSFSYATTSYVPDQVVVPTFATNSPATPIFSTLTADTICELAEDGSVTIKGVGSCVVSVTIPDAPYYIGTSGSATLVITKAQQADLTITSNDNVNYLATLVPTASGGSGTGALSFLVEGDCRIIGGTLLPGDAGAECAITARKLGDANYLTKYSEPMTITINKISQTALRIGNSATLSVGDVELFTVGGSGTGAVSYTITTQRTVSGVDQCVIIDGNKLRALSNGQCGVSATKATSTNYLVALSPQKTITFTKADQSVSFTSMIPEMPLPGQLYEPRASATSTLPVVFSITQGSGTICEWDLTSGTKVKFLASGSCEITATQAGNEQYVQATAVQTIVVSARNQTINFAAIANRNFGSPSFYLSATATSGLAVEYELGQQLASNACTVSETGMVTLTAAGKCEIVASQPGNQVYLAAPPVSQIFEIAAVQAAAPHLVSISAGNQTLTASFNPPSNTGGAPILGYRLVATNGDGDEYINPGCVTGTAPISCTLNGVPNDVSYTLKVAAMTIAGAGIYSTDSLSITTSDSEIAVKDLYAEKTLQNLTLNWDSPDALDGTFQQYDVYVWPLGEDQPAEPTISIEDESAVSANFTTQAPVVQLFRFAMFRTLSVTPQLEEAPAYEFAVVTITENSQSKISQNTTYGLQQSLTTPGLPTQLELNEVDDKLLLGWSSPIFDGGYEIEDYDVTLNGEVLCANDTTLLCQHEGLVPGTTYTFGVAARNALGLGEVATIEYSIPLPPSSGGAGSAATYDGPVVNKVSPNPAKAGQKIALIGFNLETVSKVQIYGRSLPIFFLSTGRIETTLPKDIKPGTYDVILTSDAGRLEVQNILTVIAGQVTQEPADDSDSDGTDTSSGSSGSSSSGSSGSSTSSQTPGAAHNDADGDGIPDGFDVDPTPSSEPQPSATATPGQESGSEGDSSNGSAPANGTSNGGSFGILFALMLALAAISYLVRRGARSRQAED